MATSPFTWGAQGKKMSPEEVARQRAVAALLSQEAIDTSPVGHWSQGAARLVNAFSGVRKERQASAAEEQGRSGAKSVIDALLGGGNVSMSSSGAPASPASMPVVDGGVGFAGQTPSAPVGNIAQRLRMGMIERGLPEHVADGFLMNFQDESGLNPGINEQNPTVPGSRGGFGLYQLTGPRRVAYEQFAQQRGVSPADPDAQLDFLMTELQGPESRAAQSIMAAPDAGTAAAAIARDFLRPAPEHLQRRVAQYTGGQGVSASSMGGGASQGTSPVMQALLQASTDPWVAQEYGPVLQALMGQEQSRQQFAMEQADPMRQLEMQKAQLEIEQMRNPDAPKPIEVGGVLLDPVTYQPIFDSRQQEAPTRLITGDEAVKMGLPPGAYNMGADGKVTAIGGGGTTINNNMPGQDEFDKAFAKGDADTLATISNTGMAAQRNIGRIDELDSLLANNPTGFAAAGKQKLGEWGIATEGLDDLQAAQALVNSLVPEQRQPGSGPMSDADLALFKQSLPRLINQPGGNAQIIGTMRAIAEYDAAGAEIVQRVRAGEMTRSEGFAALQGRVNPLERLKEEAPARGGILPAPPDTGSVTQVGPMPKRLRYNPATGALE